ncbi:MAG TPA: hypothetical protein VH277_07775, partial [Gemmatimonadaceae bacterium]|nr:hypothetical protein [Gemmatimonadaceae bacterium]
RALGTGRLVPLTSNSSQVVAYLRRAGNDAVLVLVNLGQSPVSSLTIASTDGALPAGRYATRALLGRGSDAGVVVGTTGRLAGAAPLGRALAPGESVVLELARP